MNIIATNNPEIADACTDLDTGLAIARACLMLYLDDTAEEHKHFFQESRHELHQMVGAVIDYIRSAQVTLEVIADREEHSPHTTE